MPRLLAFFLACKSILRIEEFWSCVWPTQISISGLLVSVGLLQKQREYCTELRDTLYRSTCVYDSNSSSLAGTPGYIRMECLRVYTSCTSAICQKQLNNLQTKIAGMARLRVWLEFEGIFWWTSQWHKAFGSDWDGKTSTYSTRRFLRKSGMGRKEACSLLMGHLLLTIETSPMQGSIAFCILGKDILQIQSTP